MAPSKREPTTDSRRRGKTPQERAEEAAAIQRQLKREAAERREAAARRPAPSNR